MCLARCLLDNGCAVFLDTVAVIFVVVVTWSYKVFSKVQLLLVGATNRAKAISWESGGAVQDGWMALSTAPRAQGKGCWKGGKVEAPNLCAWPPRCEPPMGKQRL